MHDKYKWIRRTTMSSSATLSHSSGHLCPNTVSSKLLTIHCRRSYRSDPMSGVVKQNQNESNHLKTQCVRQTSSPIIEIFGNCLDSEVMIQFWALLSASVCKSLIPYSFVDIEETISDRKS